MELHNGVVTERKYNTVIYKFLQLKLRGIYIFGNTDLILLDRDNNSAVNTIFSPSSSTCAYNLIFFLKTILMKSDLVQSSEYFFSLTE